MRWLHNGRLFRSLCWTLCRGLCVSLVWYCSTSTRSILSRTLHARYSSSLLLLCNKLLKRRLSLCREIRRCCCSLRRIVTGVRSTGLAVGKEVWQATRVGKVLVEKL